MNHTDPVTKITILPRGRALGYTMVLPLEDRYSVTRNELLDQLAYAMGGRVAEEIVFHDPTTRRIERHREGHRHRPQDGHRVRHERDDRLRQARRRVGRDVPRPRHGPPARLLRGARREGRRRGARPHRGSARRGLPGASTTTATSSTAWPPSCSRRRRSTTTQLAEIFKDVKQAARAPAVALERRSGPCPTCPPSRFRAPRRRSIRRGGRRHRFGSPEPKRSRTPRIKPRPATA